MPDLTGLTFDVALRKLVEVYPESHPQTDRPGGPGRPQRSIQYAIRKRRENGAARTRPPPRDVLAPTTSEPVPGGLPLSEDIRKAHEPGPTPGWSLRPAPSPTGHGYGLSTRYAARSPATSTPATPTTTNTAAAGRDQRAAPTSASPTPQAFTEASAAHRESEGSLKIMLSPVFPPSMGRSHYGLAKGSTVPTAGRG
jgi:hypothetical protein